MQLMCDAISVLGSRHGLVMDPIHKECSIIRFDKWDTHFGKDHGMARFGLRAGVRIEGREYLFPLCKDGGTFSFFDQRLSPCSTSFTGVHDKSAIKVKLEFVTPSRSV